MGSDQVPLLGGVTRRHRNTTIHSVSASARHRNCQLHRLLTLRRHAACQDWFDVRKSTSMYACSASCMGHGRIGKVPMWLSLGMTPDIEAPESRHTTTPRE